VPGDEVHDSLAGMAEAVPDSGRARTGPRHAAPRKSLLTRLHVPPGKAIAIAAMPSAVLMGMGLTPQLASAKTLPKSPFRDGPCVSVPDRAPDGADKKTDKSAQDEAAKDSAKDQSAKDEQDATPDKAQPKPTPSDSASGKDDSGSAGSTDKPTPSPSPSQQDGGGSGGGGLLGGVGSVLGGLLGGGSSQQDSTASQSSTDDSSSSSSSTDAKKSSDPVSHTVDGVKDGVKDVTGSVGDTLNKAEKSAQKAGQDAKDAAGKATGDKAAATKDDGGKKAFPCVEEKKVAGTHEQAPVTLPNQPWHLESSLLALHGLHYYGVVNLRTADGSTKQALKFTASGIDIGDLHQIIDGPNGLKYHVQAAPGSTSTIRHGTVTLYTEKLSGNLFGLIPITFDPEHPPPLQTPEVFFTNAKVTQAGQFGGTLTVPGLHSYMTGA
jgi:hypothetical protein